MSVRGIDAVAPDLFGRHRVRGPEAGADHGQAGLGGVGVHQLRDAEVQQLDDPLVADGRHEDVAGLEIAVNDPLLVRDLQRRADRLEDLQHLDRREPAPIVQQRADVGPFQQLHHVERPPVGERVELEDVDDGRVLDHVDGLRFANEARHHLRRRRQLPAQHLDRGLAAQNLVVGLVDRAATARSDLLLQDVGAGQRPGRQRVGVEERSSARSGAATSAPAARRHRRRLIRAEGSSLVFVVRFGEHGHPGRRRNRAAYGTIGQSVPNI